MAHGATSSSSPFFHLVSLLVACARDHALLPFPEKRLLIALLVATDDMLAIVKPRPLVSALLIILPVLPEHHSFVSSMIASQSDYRRRGKSHFVPGGQSILHSAIIMPRLDIVLPSIAPRRNVLSIASAHETSFHSPASQEQQSFVTNSRDGSRCTLQGLPSCLRLHTRRPHTSPSCCLCG